MSAVVLQLLAGCQQTGDRETGGIRASSGVPLLQEASLAAPERDDPPALRAAIERRQREALALFRKARRAHADAAGGCVHARPTMAGPPQPERWLPRAPKIAARLLGRQVEVDVQLQGTPASLACRPAEFAIVVSSGEGGTGSFNNIGGVGEYLLFGPGVRTAPRRFRVLGRIPYNGSPPYHLSVNVANALGMRSPYVEEVLRCPTTGDETRGCLPGPDIQSHAITIPSPVLPVRGASPRALARSLSAAFAWDMGSRSIGGVTCSSAAACSVTVGDSLRDVRGAARYRIQGEQVAGCWLGTLIGIEHTPPQGEISMPQSVGGCVAWR